MTTHGIHQCFHCNDYIKSGTTIYRGYDCNFCSSLCRSKQYPLIQQIDPRLSSPEIRKTISNDSNNSNNIKSYSKKCHDYLNDPYDFDNYNVIYELSKYNSTNDENIANENIYNKLLFNTITKGISICWKFYSKICYG